MKQGKATGPDFIQDRIYKDNNKFLSPIITKLINNYMEQCIFPSSLKNGRIFPIHKGGDQYVLKNYKPLSILNGMAKIYEKVIHKSQQNFC